MKNEKRKKADEGLNGKIKQRRAGGENCESCFLCSQIKNLIYSTGSCLIVDVAAAVVTERKNLCEDMKIIKSQIQQVKVKYK